MQAPGQFFCLFADIDYKNSYIAEHSTICVIL